MQKLSIIIPNYNYGRFLADAIDSALAVDWRDVEVIVVDDGSSDNSLEVLARYADRVVVMVQENAGPRIACNRGFAASHGDTVIFLDSDDILEPEIAREVAAVWRPGVSKVQVRMRRINHSGVVAGRAFPNYHDVPTPQQIRQWMNKTGAYPTPPGSGNVYAREFLEQLFPLDDSCGDATDSACLAAAPYLGDVLTIPKLLANYRVHGANRSGVLADHRRLTRHIERAYDRHRYAQELSRAYLDEAHLLKILVRGRHLLQLRVAERRLCAGAPPLPTDNRKKLLWDSIMNVFSPGPERAWYRVAILAWCLATLLAPTPLARRLVVWRFTKAVV